MTTQGAPAAIARTPGRPSAAQLAWTALAAIAAGVLAYAAFAAFGVGKPDHVALFDPWLYNIVWLAIVAVTAWRAVARSEDRVAWSLMACAMAMASGSALTFALDAPPWLQDTTRLLVYPFYCGGILALALPGRATRFRDGLLDALPAALAAGTLFAVVLVPRVEVASAVTSQSLWIASAQVAGDIAIAACAAALFVDVSRVRGSFSPWLLGAGGTAAAVADTVLLVQVVNGTYQPDGAAFALFPLSGLLVATAAWAPRREPAAGATRDAGRWVLIGVAGLAIVALVLAAMEQVDWALVTGGAAVAISGARIYDAGVRAIERARREEEAIREADAFKATLLGGFSHEILGPLTAISVAAENVARTTSPERRDEFTSMIREEVDGMRGFVAAVLDLTRAEAGGLRPETRPVGVHDVVSDALAAARAECGVEDVDTDVPVDLEMTADPALATRIVVNLLQNAARHGAPPVRIAATEAGAAVRITVEDGGTGVSEESLGELFAVSRSRAGSGLGVGLALSRALAQAQGGALTHEPLPGVPGRFVLTLPGSAPE